MSRLTVIELTDGEVKALVAAGRAPSAPANPIDLSAAALKLAPTAQPARSLVVLREIAEGDGPLAEKAKAVLVELGDRVAADAHEGPADDEPAWWLERRRLADIDAAHGGGFG